MWGKCRLKQQHSIDGFKRMQRAKQWMQATEVLILTYLILKEKEFIWGTVDLAMQNVGFIIQSTQKNYSFQPK